MPVYDALDFHRSTSKTLNGLRAARTSKGIEGNRGLRASRIEDLQGILMEI